MDKAVVQWLMGVLTPYPTVSTCIAVVLMFIGVTWALAKAAEAVGKAVVTLRKAFKAWRK